MAAERLLLTREEAAELLNMSLSHFQRHVQPYLPCLYSGRRRLYRLSDLERWVDRAVSRPRG
jgi:excisionase family DNA binding protein